MLKYHSKSDVITEAHRRGSQAKTYKPALRYLLAHLPSGNPIFKNNPFKTFDFPVGYHSYWDRDAHAINKYYESKLHTRAQGFCDDLGLETRDITEARNRKRREARKQKQLEPYSVAAHRTTPSAAVDNYLELQEFAPRKKMALYRVDAWVKYSRNENWYYEMACLVIFDRDSGDYNAIRVSPKCYSIQKALDYLKPTEVHKAEKAKKRVLRQGDMYFIPQRSWNLSELIGSNHTPWYEMGRSGALYRWIGEKLNGHRVVIEHPHHKPITLNTPHKVRQQITVFGRAHAAAD